MNLFAAGAEKLGLFGSVKLGSKTDLFCYIFTMVI